MLHASVCILDDSIDKKNDYASLPLLSRREIVFFSFFASNEDTFLVKIEMMTAVFF